MCAPMIFLVCLTSLSHNSHLNMRDTTSELPYCSLENKGFGISWTRELLEVIFFKWVNFFGKQHIHLQLDIKIAIFRHTTHFMANSAYIKNIDTLKVKSTVDHQTWSFLGHLGENYSAQRDLRLLPAVDKRFRTCQTFYFRGSRLGSKAGKLSMLYWLCSTPNYVSMLYPSMSMLYAKTKFDYALQKFEHALHG